MQVNKKIATEMLPSSLVAVVIVLFLARTGSGIYERLNPCQFMSRDLVQWREPLAGLTESRTTGKPVFIYFSGAAYLPKEEQYRRNYFSDPKIADAINAKYVPVKVWDKSLGDTPKDPIVNQMQSKYLQWYSQPAIQVVPVECQMVQNEHYRLPHFYSYGSVAPRNTMFNFLDENANWHPLPISPSQVVKWTRIEEAQTKANLERKPILYFFARHNDKECNEAMRELFDDDNCEHQQLKKYICCMVYDHTPTGAKNSRAVDGLVSKYKVQSYPTFIVDRASVAGQNDKVIGYRGHDSMEEFLANNK